MRRVAPLLAVALLALAPGPSIAAECPRTSVADIEDEVMCPVCGTPLALATEAPQAREERRFVQRLVEQCRSKDEIKAALRSEFGEDVLALPGDDGFDLAAYLVPVGAIGLGAAAIGAATLRWRRRRPARGGPGTAAVALDPDDAARLEADLRRYDD